MTDSGAHAHSIPVTLALTVGTTAPPAAPTVTTTTLPGGIVGHAYTATLAASGGTAPYTWTLSAGTLPAGLQLSGAGTIAGTPTAAATASITVTVTDANAQTGSATLPLTVLKALAVTTPALPNGQVGVAYSAALAATGGTTPYTWKLAQGSALPAGLGLAPSGVVSGTPTATASGAMVTVTVTDSGTPQPQSANATLTINVSPASTGVTVTPARAGLTVTQTLTLTATTNDVAGVTWSISPAGGSFNPTSSHSGDTVTFTAPATAGVYTITATGVTDTTRKASITVGVTDLAGVYTAHNDRARDGVNSREYALTKLTVNTASFGKLFSCTVDGAVYAQPLWVASQTISGARHNVVFVATGHDSLYAFDADASPCQELWPHVSLIDTAHGAAAAGETTVPAGTTGFQGRDRARQSGTGSRRHRHAGDRPGDPHPLRRVQVDGRGRHQLLPAPARDRPVHRQREARLAGDHRRQPPRHVRQRRPERPLQPAAGESARGTRVRQRLGLHRLGLARGRLSLGRLGHRLRVCEQHLDADRDVSRRTEHRQGRDLDEWRCSGGR